MAQTAQLSPEELHRRERNRSKVRRSYYRKIVRAEFYDREVEEHQESLLGAARRIQHEFFSHFSFA